MAKGRGSYRIRGDRDNVESIINECNRVFGLLSDRLDKMEGFRGEARLFNTLTTAHDLVITITSKGLILKDDDDPPHYWRITIDSTGTLQQTDLGRNY